MVQINYVTRKLNKYECYFNFYEATFNAPLIVHWINVVQNQNSSFMWKSILWKPLQFLFVHYLFKKTDVFHFFLKE